MTIKPRCYFCAIHTIPVEVVWTKEELLKLSEICHQKGILVISDEIHADVVYRPHKHVPYASISKEAALNSITVMSHSKTFNTAGLTTSYVIAENKELLDKYNKGLYTAHLNMGNIFGNEALIAAYQYGEEWLEELLVYLKQNIELVKSYLDAHLPKMKVIVPESTFLIWIDCREMNLDPEEIKDFFFNKAKVAVNEGSVFGPGGAGFVRLNIGCPRTIVGKVLGQIRMAYEKL